MTARLKTKYHDEIVSGGNLVLEMGPEPASG